MSLENNDRGHWSTRLAFILAATGSAVGLGNIWKFPYITGEYGGGAFVLVYLVCIVLVGIPVMMAEILIGRRGDQNPVSTMHTLATEAGKSSSWRYVGWMGIAAGFIILCFYSVVAGWSLAYVFRVGGGMFTGVTAAENGTVFSELIADPESLLAWHTIFMVLTCIVVSRGVNAGLERAVRILMPGLFVLLLVLMVYSYNTGFFGDGLSFLFSVDFSKLTPNAVLVALGHSFFTLSLGMGAIMVYGSYLPKHISIAKTSLAIAFLDTLVALMAGMVIFPIVFANDLSPGSGPGLLFQTLPLAFGNMPGGALFGCLFFILVVFAAWSSSISLIEPVISRLVEKTKMSRVYATSMIGIAIWALGIACLLSFNLWAEVKFYGKTFFDIADDLTAKIMLPLGGLLIAVFASWVMGREAAKNELAMKQNWLFSLWCFAARYIAPLFVIVILINSFYPLEKIFAPVVAML